MFSLLRLFCYSRDENDLQAHTWEHFFMDKMYLMFYQFFMYEQFLFFKISQIPVEHLWDVGGGVRMKKIEIQLFIYLFV